MIILVKSKTYASFACMTVMLAACLIASHSVLAQVVPVVVHSQFKNDNWFPLSASDMESAAVDTALSGLSRSRYFAFLLKSEQDQADTNTGVLTLVVTLVEPAETAKITINLSLPENGGTFLSTSSGSLKNRSYQEIFRVFEEIGRSASEQINDTLKELGKLNSGGVSATAQPVEAILKLNQSFIKIELIGADGAIRLEVPGHTSHNEKVLAELGKLDQLIGKLDAHHEYVKERDTVTGKKLDDIYSSIQVLNHNLGIELPEKESLTEADVTALALLEESLKYKYKHVFESADKKLDQIMSLKGLSPQVSDMIEEEKDFNLPLFEGQVMTMELRLGFMEMRNDGSYRSRINEIKKIYIDVLKRKDTDFKRQVEVKQKLDELMLMSGDMDVIDKFASKTAYQNFRRLMMTWNSRQMVMGNGKSTCPDDDELGQMVRQASILNDIHAVKEISYGCEVVFKRAARDYVIVKGSDMQYEVIESSSF